MKRSERAERRSSIRTRKNVSFRKGIIQAVFILTVIASVFIILVSTGNKIQAEESDTACKQYRSVLINPGDSLWSIASEYMDGHYSSIQQYIDELKYINHLSSDTIYSDKYLLVPYYAG